MSVYTTINPATGERVAEFAELSDAEVQDVLARTASAYTAWRTTSLEERSAVLRRVAELHRERAEELAALLTLEMGKPITEARAEVGLVANIYEYYADNGARFLADEKLEIAGPGEAIVRTESIGAILGIMPWNFPYYQVARFAAPNLMLGNTILIKHARNCPQSALAIETVLHDAGVPADAYINVFVSNAQVSTMIADPRVQGVSLTGSERAGSAVAEVAGRHLKKYVLELGGSDPFIVLPDADIDAAVRDGVRGRLYNGGQACTASKRFIVTDAVYDAFTEGMLQAMSAQVPGDPTADDTTFGPLSSAAAVDELKELVEDAVAKGATATTGVTGPADGAYFPATVLTGVEPGMRAYTEELFGPVAVVFKAADEAEAINLANDTPFGLGSSIYTTDIARGQELARSIDAGMVWINGVSRSAPDMPFGGVKRSGVGRELARFGMDEFANKKLVRILGKLSMAEAVVVTGGTSGLGAAVVRRFAADGFAVHAFDLRAGEELDGVVYHQVDVRDDEQVAAAFAAVAAAGVPLRGVVHCAGIAAFGPTRPGRLIDPETLDPVPNLDTIENVLRTNVLGTFSVVRHGASLLARNGRHPEEENGFIVLTSSGAAYEGKAGQSGYSASKSAILGMTMPLAREFSPYGIRVVTIAPGLFDTPILDDTPKIERHVPYPNRVGRPDEFAALVRHIGENPYLNSENIRIDGGARGEFQAANPFIR